jgi:hypothetical protein
MVMQIIRCVQDPNNRTGLGFKGAALQRLQVVSETRLLVSSSDEEENEVTHLLLPKRLSLWYALMRTDML